MTDRFSDGQRVSRAKVWVSDVTSREQAPQGKPGVVTYRVEDVTFSFVNGNDADSENRKFWEASPTSQPFHLLIANTVLHGTFRPGQEYYLDFVEAVRTPGEG